MDRLENLLAMQNDIQTFPLLLLIDAQDHIVQTVALRAASKGRAVEMGEAVRSGTPRAHRYQLWLGGRKVFEMAVPASLH